MATILGHISDGHRPIGDALDEEAPKTADQPHVPALVQFKSVSAGGPILIGNTIYTRSDLEELEEYLSRVVSAYERDTFQAVLRRSMPTDPYKSLDSFGLKDEPIFFGREVAKEELAQTVLRNRLTVLHAKSGAGKTSLLNAGLSPRFIREGRLPLYVDAYYRDEDPVVAVKRRIASAEHGKWPRLLHALSLLEFLGLVCQRLSRNTHELVVILDQFEQFFILWSRSEARHSFIKALSLCYNDQTLPLRFIIALRKDYNSDPAEFRRVAPSLRVLDEECQVPLTPMTVEEVQAGITGPLAKLGFSLTYEPALLKTLLVDLTRNEIELPLLQIICTRLYKETHMTGEIEIPLKAYEALGGTEEVLRSYLKSRLDQLPEREKALARSVLKELVHSDGTKQLLSDTVLAVRTQAQKDELSDMLNRLIDDLRLVHRYEGEGEAHYTLVHEYLATEILTWMDVADQEFKRAEELLQRELVNWRVLHVPIPRNRLEVLYPYRERFKDVDTEAWRCLISSANAEDFAVADWAKTAGAIGELVLIEALKTADAEIYRRGVKALAEFGGPRAVEPLLVALKDEDEEVWLQAARALGRIGDPRTVELLIAALKDKKREARGQVALARRRSRDSQTVEWLIVALNDEDEEVRQWADGVLEEFRGWRTANWLLFALNDKDKEVWWWTVRALRKIGNPQAVRLLIAALEYEDEEALRPVARALREIGAPEAVYAVFHKIFHKKRR